MLNKLYVAKIICIAVCMILSNTLESVIIVVHGTFAQESAWARPGGFFYDELEYQASIFGHKLVPFCWSGNSLDVHRLQAAIALVKTMLSYPTDEEIIIVGHSHGGNVITLASQLLTKPDLNLLPVIKPNQPDAVIYEHLNHLATLRSLTSTQDFVHQSQKPDFDWNHALQKARQEIAEFYQTRLNVRALWQPTIYRTISRAYLLATPVLIPRYNPDMRVIKELYHFYSMADIIQPVLGTYQRTFRNEKNLVNFSVTFEDNNGNAFAPGHTEIHTIQLARWLLAMPKLLKKYNFPGFYLYQNDLDGSIHIPRSGKPSYDRPLPRLSAFKPRY